LPPLDGRRITAVWCAWRKLKIEYVEIVAATICVCGFAQNQLHVVLYKADWRANRRSADALIATESSNEFH
jgi:hypothetical protein